MTANLTVPVPVTADLVASIDKVDANRESFVARAIRHELARHQVRALVVPHPDSVVLTEMDFDEWAALMPEEDADLIDDTAIVHVQWDDDAGWTRIER